MLTAGVDKVHRDLILDHSLKGMDVHYMAPDEKTLKEAMEKYTSGLMLNSKMLTKMLTKKESKQIKLLLKYYETSIYEHITSQIPK